MKSTQQHIAIIIPALNEEKFIGKCLDSIVSCHYPKEYLRVFVVDGLSEDRTAEVVKQYSTQNPWIQLILNPNKTTPFAFNLGIKASNDATILITVGAHSEIAPDFIEKVIETFSISNEIGCVGGCLENVYEDELSKCIGLAMSSLFGVGNAHFRTGDKDGFVDTVGFPAYKREVFEKVGFFNESLVRNQDDEFNYRVTKAGFKIYLNRAIKSKYYVRGSFDKLYRQYFQYGYWKVYVNQMHKTVTSTRQLIPPLFVAFLFIGFIFSLLSWFLAGFYFGVIAVYLTIAFLFASRLTGQFKEVLFVVYTFMVLHVGYGLGYLKGILDFTLLKKRPSAKSTEITR